MSAPGAPARESPDPRAPAAAPTSSGFRPRLRARARFGVLFHAGTLLATLVGILVLGVLLADIIADGSGRLSGDFLRHNPSYLASRAGLRPALFGTIWLMVITAVTAFPLGVGTAIWLEEYAGNSRLKRLIQMNITNLAGVPSIVYGILGLTVFVRALALGRSVLAGALTLALLILPVIIIAAQEAIRAVPSSIRLAAYALGATRWETVRFHVLPLALPGILTGTILALSRAIGEAAPLLLIGALAFIDFVPRSLTDQFTAIPIQIYDWVSRPQQPFQELAAAAGIILLLLLLGMNAVAIVLRNRYSRRD